MSRSRRRRPAPPSPDDARLGGGVDPFAFESHQQEPDRKLLQLCAQVERALGLALGDRPASRDLMVESVHGFPGARRLLVLLRPCTPGDASERPDILARLAEVNGHLRHEVAAAIHRKRAPELVFELAALEGLNHEPGEETP